MPDGQSPETWISIKDHLLALLRELEEKVGLRIEAMDRALELARKESDRRMNNLNELRQELLTDRSLFVRQDSHDTTQQELNRWREEVTTRLTVIETRAITWAAAIGFLVLLISLALRWVGK